MRMMKNGEAVEFAEADKHRILNLLFKDAEEERIEIKSPIICIKGVAEDFKAGYTYAEHELRRSVKEAAVKRVIEVRVDGVENDRFLDYMMLTAVCLK